MTSAKVAWTRMSIPEMRAIRNDHFIARVAGRVPARYQSIGQHVPTGSLRRYGSLPTLLLDATEPLTLSRSEVDFSRVKERQAYEQPKYRTSRSNGVAYSVHHERSAVGGTEVPPLRLGDRPPRFSGSEPPPPGRCFFVSGRRKSVRADPNVRTDETSPSNEFVP
jgi:hypothetical protein